MLLKDIWILVSVQRDVSLLPAADLPSNDACMLKARVMPVSLEVFHKVQRAFDGQLVEMARDSGSVWI